MKKIILISVLILIAGSGISYADIYKYVDENGITHFTNIQTGQGYEKFITEGTKAVSSGSGKKSYSLDRIDDYTQIISNKSIKYDLEPSLINAVIQVESNWNSSAVSPKGARGLMQLMPSTAKDMDVSNPFSPEENIDGGTKYLRYLLDRYNGDLSLALAAYNAGPERVEKSGGIPQIQETRQYVKKVLSLYNRTDTSPAPIYKLKTSDGTVLYTNTPSLYKGATFSKF